VRDWNSEIARGKTADRKLAREFVGDVPAKLRKITLVHTDEQQAPCPAPDMISVSITGHRSGGTVSIHRIGCKSLEINMPG
jgi:hypothetical protein